MQIKSKANSLLLIVCLFILSLVMLGNYSAKADNGPGISVGPNYPKEQIQNNGIFNVRFNSNQHYNLTLNVANTSNENKTIIITPNTAYTSNGGILSFDKSNPPSDSSKKYDFRSLFDQKEKKVTIPAKSISKVSFGLKMPSEPYQGVMVGGFYITIPNSNKSNVKNNFTIKNSFSYGLAAVIHNNAEIAQPAVQLGNVISNNDNNQMQINSNIRNIGAGIIGGMNVKSEIVKTSNNSIVSRSDRNNLSMAPNSSFNYTDTIENSLSPGSYRVKMNITDDSGHTWNESKDFRINTQEYVTHFTKKVPWTLYTLIGIIVLLALVIIFLVYHQFRSKKKNNSQSNNQNKSNTKNNE